MVTSEEITTYSSLSKLDTANHDDRERADFLVDHHSGSLSSPRGSRQDYLCQPSSKPDFPDNNSTQEPCFISQNGANHKGNLKNVLSGLSAMVTSRNLVDGAIQSQLNSSLDISFLSSELNGDSFLCPSVCMPSAPPLLGVESVNYSAYKDILAAEPPEWLPDSYSKVCMQCNSPFTAITRGRHHCRFCGGIFCRDCTKGRCLLPVKFQERNPQRVCDTCYDKLDSLQSILINSNSNAVQSAKHDVTDWTCMRGWLNLPVGLSMEYEIYKATNTLRSYCQVARLNPEKSIPWSVLRGAKGLAILTVVKVGALLTYKVGSGLVISRRVDGSWSAPSAILSVGLGWGAQIGGELMDFIIVLHGSKVVKAFSSHMHISFGAGISAAAGPVGRVFEADLRAGAKGSGICYTYSCSKGAFVGVSMEGNVVATRMDANLRFYGDPYLTTGDILFGTVERPKAAAPLYLALDELYSKVS